MITILAALNDEIRLIKSEMEIDEAIHLRPFVIYIGKYQHKKIMLVRTGVGMKNMELAISYCVEHLKPTEFINIGYAGGLDPRLQAGDVVIAKNILDETTDRNWVPDRRLIEKAESVAKIAELRNHTGNILMVEKPLSEPHEKAFAGTKFDACACDMESAAFAEVATKANLPFIVVRTILDPLDTLLPNIPEEAIIDGGVSVGSMLGHLKSNPKDILKLPRFSYLCSQARIAMTTFIKTWVGHEQD